MSRVVERCIGYERMGFYFTDVRGKVWGGDGGGR